MEDRNTVTVKVFGQEYTLTGEMSRERILRLADYVDSKMHEVGDFYKGPVSSVAVLSAMTIAEELFSRENQENEIISLRQKLEENQRFNDVLRGRVDELTKALEQSKSIPEETQKLIAELEAKSRDIESSFFDLQMENIHLKNELETLKKQNQYK